MSDVSEITPLSPSAGTRLRETREGASLNLALVAKTLNVSVAVLEALERDDYAYFSAPVFARGHLKKYAGYLSLPVDELLSAYDVEINTPAQPSLIPPMKLPTPNRAEVALKWVVGVVALGLLVAGVIFFLVHGPLQWIEAETEHVTAPAASKAPVDHVPPVRQDVRPDQQATEVPVAVLPPEAAKADK